jgi:hypothetical protein
MLGDRREDVDREPVRLREVRCNEIDSGFHEVTDERNVTGEAVKLRDDELGATEPAASAGASAFTPASENHPEFRDLPQPKLTSNGTGAS